MSAILILQKYCAHECANYLFFDCNENRATVLLMTFERFQKMLIDFMEFSATSNRLCQYSTVMGISK